MIYRDEPYPDEMDQSRDWLIRQDEESAVVAGAEGNARAAALVPSTPARPVSAADPDKLLAEFAELLLAISAARSVA